MLFKGHVVTLDILGEGLLVKDGGDYEGVRGLKLLLGELCLVQGLKWESQNFVPLWHGSFISLSTLNDGVGLMILDLNFNISLYLWHVFDCLLAGSSAHHWSLLLNLGLIIVLSIHA